MPPVSPLRRNVVLLLAGQALLLWAIFWGASYQMRLVEQKIAEMAELKDPSPFRAALLGQLNTINLNLLGYVQNRDRAPLEQIAAGEQGFERSLDEFQKQNPRLLPAAAHAKILDAYQPYKEAVDKIFETSSHQAQSWEELAQNDGRMSALMDRGLKPLAQKDEHRANLILNLENQLNAVPQDLTQYLFDHSEASSAQVEQSERKFSALLKSYQTLSSSPKEHRLIQLIQTLWDDNVIRVQEILALEKARTEAFSQMLEGHQNLQATLSTTLPAVRPEVLEAQKRSMFHTIALMIVLTAVMAVAGAGSCLASALWIYKQMKGTKGTAKPPQREALIGMSLDGHIVSWNLEAEHLYGYIARDILGSSIAKLFASEEEIARLHKNLKESVKANFDALHLTRNGARIKVRLTFGQEANTHGQTAGIVLTVQRLAE